MPKIRAKVANSSWLRQRELGQRLPLGHSDHFSKGLYSSILPCHSWDHGENLRNAMHGGVFNLEFSPDGSLLVAACEKKSILMFDPLCRKLIHAVDNAHRDCVNCVRFLDSRVFATCSDDSTVALWDARNLKSQIRTLHGHSNWVKNIEFSSRDGLLVTSGFDGSIYTWDINSYTESGFVYNRVFHTNGLMRTRLNPDASKMIICTTGGYLMIVHNLDLNTLAQDLNGFKPNMYRLMQLSQTTIPLAADFTHLFSQQRKINRVELITDFPKGDDAEVVSSLQIHPQGWCALSRNISNDESSEWTCVHDIQEREYSAGESDSHSESENEPYVDSLSQSRESSVQDSDSDSEPEVPRRRRIRCVRTATGNVLFAAHTHTRTTRPTVEVRMDSAPTLSRSRSMVSSERSGSPNTGRMGRTGSADGIPIEAYRRGAVGDVGRVAISSANVELHVSSADVWEALMAIREARIRRERERELAERAEQERDRAGRAERERPRNVNVRIRMHSSSLGSTESERRNSDESRSANSSNSSNNSNNNNSSSGSEEWMQGRVRILVRRNPDSNVPSSEGSNRADGNSHGSGQGNSERVNTRSQRISSPPPGAASNSTSNQDRMEMGFMGFNVPSSSSSGTTHSAHHNSTDQGSNTGGAPTVFIRSRNSPANTILIVDNRMPRTASAAVIAPLSGGSEPSTVFRRSDFSDFPKLNRRIHQNIPRLTHYIEEPNVGKGFIKELCFSADGRLICSPFGYGVRLLAFSPECSELSICCPDKAPVPLYELATNVCHSDIVVSTKFSPQHCLLVSGCLSGKIVWHQPVV
ncbi:DDB1- and CUL4-associated factor 10 homolog [Gryllus bimaculatus]|nr:DDB1- and CUL4-associated factor 10 homolog [Gryllus bimaculatus]